MKAGSTSLHNYLNQHPDIHMSEPKELNFFNNTVNFNKGIKWYLQFFDPKAVYNGESSINYSKAHTFPDVPKRIKTALSEKLKLIYVVRDPVDRLLSNFTDSKTYGDIPVSCSINDFFSGDLNTNPLIKTSQYYYQISQYLRYFDKANIHFIRSEKLKANVQNEMNRLFGFLDLNPVTIEQINLNASADKKYIDEKLKGFLQNGVVKNIKSLLPNVARKKISGFVVKKISKTVADDPKNLLSEVRRESLKNFFQDDMIKFKALTGIDYTQ